MLTYILRRMIFMLPLIIVISIFAFIVIQLPPGDFLTNYIMELRLQGDDVTDAEIESIAKRYGLNDPGYIRYIKWASGFLVGDLGYSMKYNQPVSNLIKKRIGYTLLISLLVLLFQWVISIPVGIYSAIKQYSIGDYIITLLGFLGLSIPNFMLALILMFVAFKYFGSSVTGLISSEYIGQPWTYGKIIDMMSHVWVPVIVVGSAGTAGLIRVLRGQMLDELGKEYVQTARAKGLTEKVVIFKHILRVAINPIISTIGWLLPRIFSGATLTGIVLGLPTLGPLLLSALMNQDMFLAGSILMIQSMLVLIGTLISDILLAVVDPRIRYS